jgi:hypothetical protein
VNNENARQTKTIARSAITEQHLCENKFINSRRPIATSAS